MKNTFDENKSGKNKLIEFFDKKGFYIVLILCLAIVGGTAVYVTTKGVNDNNDKISEIIPGEEDDIISDVGGDAAKEEDSNIASNIAKVADTDNKSSPTPSLSPTATPAASPSPSVQPTQKPAPKNATPSPTAKPAPAKKTITLVSPVIGKIYREFSDQIPVYSNTFEDWRVHKGIDIEADRGTVVKAAADGFVSSIEEDPQKGVVIVIDHRNGFKTVYCNLASGDMVSVNQIVKAGDIIGCIGNTAKFEIADPPHLHFEVLLDGKEVDPLKFLNIKK